MIPFTDEDRRICRAAFEMSKSFSDNFSPDRALMQSDDAASEYTDPSCQSAWNAWVEAWCASRAAPVILESCEGVAWAPEGYPDSKEKVRTIFLEGMKAAGLGDGSRGWIEHSANGKLVRDTLSLEGEILLGLLDVKDKLDEACAVAHQKPAAWYDCAVGGFYLSEESIPAGTKTPGRIHALIYKHPEESPRKKV